MRNKDDFFDLIVLGTPLPPLEENEVDMPQGIYVCMDCGAVNNYHKTWCEKCDQKLDRLGL